MPLPPSARTKHEAPGAVGEAGIESRLVQRRQARNRGGGERLREEGRQGGFQSVEGGVHREEGGGEVSRQGGVHVGDSGAQGVGCGVCSVLCAVAACAPHMNFLSGTPGPGSTDRTHQAPDSRTAAPRGYTKPVLSWDVRQRNVRLRLVALLGYLWRAREYCSRPPLAPLRTPAPAPRYQPTTHLAPNPPSLQRFYVGRPVSGLVWLFTGGLLGVGWVVDFFLLRDFVEGAWGGCSGVCVCEEGASVSRRARLPRRRCR